MTNKWFKRSLALLMALLMALPMAAWAEEPDFVESVESDPIDAAVLETDEMLLPGMEIAELPQLDEGAEETPQPETSEPEIDIVPDPTEFTPDEIMIEDEVPVDEDFFEGEVPVEGYVEVEFPGETGDDEADELFDAYAQQVLGIVNPSLQQFRHLGNDLTGINQLLYSYLAERTEAIAAGREKDSKFTIPLATLGLDDAKWTTKQMGISSVSAFTTTVFESMTGLTARKVMNTLMADYPYELYWYWKTVGYRYGYKYKYTSTKVQITSFTFSMAVNQEYAAGDYVVSSARISVVQQAAANARSIVSANSGKSDLSKMEAYWRKICELVKYNQTAFNQSKTNSKMYGNPWQLIWVFDGDSSTDVVCEGYAKAFKYLCDLSSFTGDVFCYTVTGNQGGPHMWNVVQMPDGRNYIVDVTRCDSNPSDPVFLKPYISGSVSQGYTFRWGSSTLTYTYDDDTRTVYSGSQLTLSSTAYNASNAKNGVQSVSISPAGTQTLYLGHVLQLTASIYPSNAANASLTWKSSKPSVATVSANGLVTPVKAGSTTITVRTYNDHTATVVVNVVKAAKPTKVALNYSGTVAVNVDKTLQLLPILSPANASTTYTWKSSKTSVAKVSKTGLVTPVATGTTTITVKTANSKSASVKVKVVNPYAATSVSILSGERSVMVGDTLALFTSVYPSDAIYKLTWKSSKTSVAKVNSNGVVTGVKAGTAKITVTTDSGRTASVTVTVKGNKADGIFAKPTSSEVKNYYRGRWTLRLKSVEVKSKNKVVCEFYLLNGLGKSKQLSNISVGVKYNGTTICDGTFSKIAVSCSKNSYKVVKFVYTGNQVKNALTVGKIPTSSYGGFDYYYSGSLVYYL